MTAALSSAALDDFRQLVSEELGLHFPPTRNADLSRGLKSAARELGINGVDELAHWLHAAPAPTRSTLLARHLTVGETYFFRHRSLFEALERNILPELILTRRTGSRRLRLWSAACCTGEEAYSLAIAVHRVLPDRRGWDISIAGTDLNTSFLQKAERGVYGPWSFRDTPPDCRERYFSRVAENKWQIRPEIRSLVRFAPLNLADDLPPDSPLLGADIIFCRNALIYFTPDQATRVIRRLAASMPHGAWLATAPSEMGLVSVPTLTAVPFPGVTVYRKTSRKTKSAARPALPSATETAFAAEPPVDLKPLVRTFVEDGEPPPAVPPAPKLTDRAAPLADAARTAANRRRFPAALAHCDELVALNRCDAGVHYLRASILAESGDRTGAIDALKRVLYLDPEFILAHFALGNLYRLNDEPARADRHFTHALELARRQPPDQLVPASDGLTAGQLAQTLVAMNAGQTFR